MKIIIKEISFARFTYDMELQILVEEKKPETREDLNKIEEVVLVNCRYNVRRDKNKGMKSTMCLPLKIRRH